ncbi:hypothetical protein [Desmospora profundinema]|uniref:Uncharacterized protein n=1 Tax=Desmospora profundinema TaxID=1571184 RepID=A0ABU1IKG0_9BACL|nr:hypothetical protein [Desmospora profundinema]MDR6225267.1 hypothetical protein [Desmospora profundinema]
MEAFVHRLLDLLKKESDCQKVMHRVHAGVDFFYFSPSGLHWGERMKRLITPLIKDTEVSFECRYVRRSQERDVYRIHFRVPDEKSFCCGNQCMDCILLRGYRHSETRQRE